MSDDHAESEFEEMAVYNRALTPEELDQHFRSKLTRFGLIRYWARVKIHRVFRRKQSDPPQQS